MSDLPALIASGGIITGIGSAFALLLRTNYLMYRQLAEVMKEQSESLRQAAAGDYAVAAVLGQIKDRLGMPNPPPQPTPAPTPPAAPGQGGVT